MALVRVIGLGPGPLDLLTTRARTLLATTSPDAARLRTRRHPALEEFEAARALTSYDDWYERADSFEVLYRDIVDDLARLAHARGEVLYAVPGSPTVAEHTVELLAARDDLEVILEPAVSVIDVACSALRVDPMARSLRVVDALSGVEPFRGPGPLLVLQTYAPEVLATVADRLADDLEVVVLHHLGLSDQRIVTMPARELAHFPADHLTSLWIDGLRDAGDAMADLVDFTRRLREECPWDQEQTHESLLPHLLEEAYEAYDALERLARAQHEGEPDEELLNHAEEELGDLLFQVLFHAELGDEEGYFDLATIADALRDKLTFRHPHVFGDVVVSNADEVASRWEMLKRAEKGRTSVTDGIAWQLPALTLYAKLVGKASTLGLEHDASRWSELLELLGEDPDWWLDLLGALVTAARARDLDLEGLVRARALELRDEILGIEARSPGADGADQ